ncbi:unnamed protein product [Notodromas monacha]|uniref:C2H2-type domain-containing protein n=1 Tax=Notodromas monacha TaxID=399045 RepID=A0A7R9BI13_9CRUS|nr:unnamed protein product [Notodromas monacha]CAG0915092.1 unnamed protein product [Notodromas monacha]
MDLPRISSRQTKTLPRLRREPDPKNEDSHGYRTPEQQDSSSPVMPFMFDKNRDIPTASSSDLASKTSSVNIGTGFLKINTEVAEGSSRSNAQVFDEIGATFLEADALLEKCLRSPKASVKLNFEVGGLSNFVHHHPSTDNEKTMFDPLIAFGCKQLLSTENLQEFPERLNENACKHFVRRYKCQKELPLQDGFKLQNLILEPLNATIAEEKPTKSQEAFRRQISSAKPFKKAHLYKCAGAFCDFSTSNPTAFYAHMHLMHRGEEKEIAKCIYCSEAFLVYAHLVKHVFTKHRNLRYQCPHCFSRRSGEEEMKQHVFQFHGGGDCVEDLCSSWENFANFFNHVGLDLPEARMKSTGQWLPFDPWSFEKLSRIPVGKIHNVLKKSSCLRTMLEKPVAKDIFKCMQYGCCFSTDAPNWFISHLEKAHRKCAAETYLFCSYCFEPANLPKELAVHVISTHGQNDCNFVDCDPENMEFHLLGHGMQKFPCRICSGRTSFASAFALLEHMNVHENHQGTCGVCSRRFRKFSEICKHAFERHPECKWDLENLDLRPISLAFRVPESLSDGADGCNSKSKVGLGMKKMEKFPARNMLACPSLVKGKSCDAHISSLSEFRNHVLTCSLKRILSCPYCVSNRQKTSSLESAFSYLKHWAHHHVNDVNYVCGSCDAPVPNAELNSHWRRKHRQDNAYIVIPADNLNDARNLSGKDSLKASGCVDPVVVLLPASSSKIFVPGMENAIGGVFLPFEWSCNVCPFTSAFVDSVKQHCLLHKAALRNLSLVVPSTSAMNKVCGLGKNEDVKMANLAYSSKEVVRTEHPANSAGEDLIKSTKYPPFVKEELRFKCPVPSCGALIPSLEELKEHMIDSGHVDCLICPHCPRLDLRSFEEFWNHLRLHGPILLQCNACHLLCASHSEMISHSREMHFAYQNVCVQPDLLLVMATRWQTVLRDLSSFVYRKEDIYHVEHVIQEPACSSDVSKNEEPLVSEQDSLIPKKVAANRKDGIEKFKRVEHYRMSILDFPKTTADVFLTRIRHPAISSELTRIKKTKAEISYLADSSDNCSLAGELNSSKPKLSNGFINVVEPPGFGNMLLKHPCDLCGARFASSGALRAHSRGEHSSKKPQHMIKCKLCSHTESTEDAMRLHFASSHPQETYDAPNSSGKASLKTCLENVTGFCGDALNLNGSGLVDFLNKCQDLKLNKRFLRTGE